MTSFLSESFEKYSGRKWNDNLESTNRFLEYLLDDKDIQDARKYENFFDIF